MKRFYFIVLLLASALSAVAQEPLSANEARKQRGFVSDECFVPKGQWITGVSVSYSQSNQDKYQFLVFENLSGDTYTFKVSPMLMYAFRDNLALGGRLGYQRQRTRLNSADVVLDS